MATDSQKPGPADASPGDTVTATIELLDRARNGDRAALDQLFARHAGPLRRWANGRLPTRARDLIDTDDVVQDALLQTFKRIGEFEATRAAARRSPSATIAFPLRGPWTESSERVSELDLT